MTVQADAPTARTPRTGRLQPLLPYWPLALPLITFVGLTIWWLAADSRIPDWDSGRHLLFTFAMRDALASGDLLAPITLDNYNNYPPLLYVVGSLVTGIGGESIDVAVAGQNLIFLPLLVVGCFGAARLAYGPLAGAVAAAFALGTPMVVSMMHAYMLDTPQAAMVALTVWLLLASRRFEARGIAALAGLAAAGGMLIKPTTVIFLAGFVLAVIVRGGWRNPFGLVAFVVPAAVVALPWYIVHFDQLQGLTAGATSAAAPAADAATTYVTPPRWSSQNFGWYAWNFLNVQYLAPLTIAFVAGVATAAWRFGRSRLPGDVTPELLAGGLVAYVGLTYLSLKDPRYTLPALVYVAVLAAGWVPSARSARVRVIAAAAVGIAATVNIVAVSTGLGSIAKVSFPGAPATLLGERSIRLYSPDGYVVSAPRNDSDVLRVMRAVRADGVPRMEVDPGGDITFSVTGLQVLLRLAGLQQPPVYRPDALGPRTAFLLRHPVPAGGPRPCGRLADGQGVYVVLASNVVIPFESYRFYCPRQAR